MLIDMSWSSFGVRLKTDIVIIGPADAFFALDINGLTFILLAMGPEPRFILISIDDDLNVELIIKIATF